MNAIVLAILVMVGLSLARVSVVFALIVATLALDPQVLGHHRRMAGGAGLGHVVHGISKRC